MTQDQSRVVVLLGGGGHSLVVADAVTEGAEILGFFDDDPNAVLGACTGLKRLGALAEFPDNAGPHVHLAIGNLAVRASLVERLAAHQTITIRHATAVLSASAEIGRDVFVGPQAVVHTAARVGDHCIVNTGAIIEHECLLGENVHVAPGAVLGGRVRVGPGTLVGLGSRVLPGVRIGAGCVVGAGAVVIRDVPDGGRVVGVPARTIG